MYLKPPYGTLLNSGHNLSRGIVGCWLFNDNPGVGGKTYDISGYGNHGTLVNDTHSVAGRFGNAIYVDGTGDYVNCGTGVGNFGTNDFTILAWVRLESSVNTYRSVMSNGQTGAGDWLFYTINIYDIRFYGNSGAILVTGTSFLTLNTWQQVAVTRSGSTVTLYGDGQILATDTSAGDSIGANHNTIIGASEDGSDRYWLGTIDHSVVWNRALTAQEIASLYAEPFQTFWVDM